MKTMKIFFPVAALAVTTLGANASTAWIGTKFWKAPVAREMKAALIPSPSLVSDCGEFRKMMFTADGSPSWITQYPEKVARFRRAIDPARFEIEAGRNLRIEETVEADTPASEEALPHYQQNRAVTSVTISDLSDVEVIAEPDSLTMISRKLNLEDTPVEFIRSSSGAMMIDLKGLDLACDLLSGKARLEGTAPAVVYLETEASAKLHGFYNEKLMPRLKDLFIGERNSRILRAVRIGHRIGTLLQEEAPETDEKKREKRTEELFSTIFLPETLAPSKNVVDVNGSKLVHIDSSVEIDSMKVSLEH